MPTIIFRDDDTSYFTSPERLEAIYGRVWEAGAPVCLAVIPWVYGDTRVYWTDGNPHDPGIPPKHRGALSNFDLCDNRELCDFLTKQAAAGLVEICLHGCSHTFYEFITHDLAVIRQKLDTGMAVLEQAFPDALIKTFIPPYDRISPAALEELVARGFHISTMSHNLAPVKKLPQISASAAGAIRAGQRLFVCDDYLFSHKRDPGESLSLARAALAQNDLTIVCNHYWAFFHPWRRRPNLPDYIAWNALLDDVLKGDEYEITSFSGYIPHPTRASKR